MKLFFLILAILIIGAGGYFFITKPHKTQSEPKSPTSLSSTPSTPPIGQTASCTQNQLTAAITTQGAAGNIYGTLELTNTGKTACAVTLGNTITATIPAKNVTIHLEQTVPTESFVLTPSQKVYSQVHFPNGPQCQSGVMQTPITFVYKTDQTSVAFQSTTPPTGKIILQSCTSPKEDTTVDIWPLAKALVTQ